MEKPEPSTLLVERRTAQLLWKAVWRFLRKFNLKSLRDPTTQLLSVQPKELKAGVQTKACTLTIIAALFTITKRWKRLECPSTDETKCITPKQWSSI